MHANPADDVPDLVTSDDWSRFQGAAPTTTQLAKANAAGAAIRRWCGWHVAPVVTQRFTGDGPGGRLLMLPTLRLLDVLAATDNGTELDLDLLEWSHDGFIRAAGCWSTRLRSIEVEISHGYDLVDDIYEVVVSAASRAQPAGVSQRTVGQVSTSYVVGGLLEVEQAKLAPYRLPRRQR